MFPLDEELSSDLEYLLQSGETAGPALIEALVREFFVPVYRLALVISDDADSAAYAAIETFVSATLDAHNYQAQVDISTWVYAWALKNCRSEYRRIWRKRFFKAVLPFFSRPEDFGTSLPETELDATLWLTIDAMPEPQRLAVLLHHLLDLNETDIAGQLNAEESEVLSWLAGAHRAAWQKLHQAGISPDVPEPLNIEKLLSGSLQRRCPQFDPSTEEIEAFIEEILYQVSKRRGRRQRSVYGKEIFMTGLVSLLAMGLIWGVNRLLPGPEPTAGAGAARQSAVTPRPTIKPTPWRVLSFDYTSQGGESLASIAEKLDLPLGALVDPPSGLQITRDPAAKTRPGDVLEFRVRSDPANLPTSTPVQPVLYSQPTLNAQSSLEQVRSRIAESESLWHTLWADVSFVFYGPQGYSGPALESSRVWVWMQLPGESLVKVFGNGSPYSYPFLVKDGVSYDFLGNSVNAKPQEEILDSSLADLLLPSLSAWFKQGEPVRILSQSSFAGRPVIIVQWEVAPDALDYRSSQSFLNNGGYPISLLSSSTNNQFNSLLLTVDAQTGVVLRLRQYIDAHGRPTLVLDKAVSQVAFDIDFYQPGLFNPLVTGFLDHTRDYRGRSYSDIPEYVPDSSALGHEQLPRVSPPAGYDPSGDWLTFQYMADSPAQTVSKLNEVDLFAGKYFLRSLQFPQIYAMVCDRSPDGSTVAYLTGEGSSSGYLSDLGTVAWLDLRQPAEIHTSASKLGVNDLAFSPKGRYLALAGYETQSGDMGVYLLDTDDGTVEQLSTAIDAWSLEWSPDGKYLAFIGTTNPPDKPGGGQMAAVIVDVSSKEITYYSELPDVEAYVALFSLPVTQRDWPPPDWPVYQWGTPFPVYSGMLGNCPQPPDRIPIKP